MSARKTAEPSPESIARFNRKRLAAEEGVRALLDVEKQATDIRKNMVTYGEPTSAPERCEEAGAYENPLATGSRHL